MSEERVEYDRLSCSDYSEPNAADEAIDAVLARINGTSTEQIIADDCRAALCPYLADYRKARKRLKVCILRGAYYGTMRSASPPRVIWHRRYTGEVDFKSEGGGVAVSVSNRRYCLFDPLGDLHCETDGVTPHIFGQMYDNAMEHCALAILCGPKRRMYGRERMDVLTLPMYPIVEAACKARGLVPASNDQA